MINSLDLLVTSDGQSKISNWIGVVCKSKLSITRLLLPQQNDIDSPQICFGCACDSMKIMFNALLKFPLKSLITTVYPSNFVRVTHVSTSNFTLSHVISCCPWNQEFNWWYIFISYMTWRPLPQESHHIFPTVMVITIIFSPHPFLCFKEERLLLSKTQLLELSSVAIIGYSIDWICWCNYVYFQLVLRMFLVNGKF